MTCFTVYKHLSFKSIAWGSIHGGRLRSPTRSQSATLGVWRPTRGNVSSSSGLGSWMEDDDSQGWLFFKRFFGEAQDVFFCGFCSSLLRGTIVFWLVVFYISIGRGMEPHFEFKPPCCCWLLGWKLQALNLLKGCLFLSLFLKGLPSLKLPVRTWK